VIRCPECEAVLKGPSSKLKVILRRHYEARHADIILSDGLVHQLMNKATSKGRLLLGRKGLISGQSIRTVSGGAPGGGRR